MATRPLQKGDDLAFRTVQHLLSAAAGKRHAHALRLLGELYLSGPAPPGGYTDCMGAECLGAAASKGDPKAMRALALCYHEGRGVPKDSAKYLGLLGSASDGGDEWASFDIGMYFLGLGDLDAAALYFGRAVGSERTQELYMLGRRHQLGRGAVEVPGEIQCEAAADGPLSGTDLGAPPAAASQPPDAKPGRLEGQAAATHRPPQHAALRASPSVGPRLLGGDLGSPGASGESAVQVEGRQRHGAAEMGTPGKQAATEQASRGWKHEWTADVARYLMDCVRGDHGDLGRCPSGCDSVIRDVEKRPLRSTSESNGSAKDEGSAQASLPEHVTKGMEEPPRVDEGQGEIVSAAMRGVIRRLWLHVLSLEEQIRSLGAEPAVPRAALMAEIASIPAGCVAAADNTANARA